MSALTLHPHEQQASPNTSMDGPTHSYYFYKELSLKTNSNLSSLSRQPKQIIPSIPRQHIKAPKNSSLSPIRSQKIMPKQDLVETETITTTASKRPYPLITTFSSPASIETTNKIKNRQRKVSFNEKVIVVASSPSLFKEEEEQETPKMRRHSTGEEATQPKSILIHGRLGLLQEEEEETILFKQKITNSLKQIKNRLLFV